MEILTASFLKYVLAAICVTVILVCCISLLRIKAPQIEPAFFIDKVSGKKYSVTHWETSIGRSNSCDIVLPFNTVSRFHAVLVKQKKGWVMTDTISRSGTFINGKKIKEPSVIKDGDTLTFGGASLLFRER